MLAFGAEEDEQIEVLHRVHRRAALEPLEGEVDRKLAADEPKLE